MISFNLNSEKLFNNFFLYRLLNIILNIIFINSQKVIILTKENNDIIVLLKNILQHLGIHFFNLPWDFKSIFIGDPRKNLVLILDVALIDQRLLIPEKSQCREILDSLFLRESCVFCSDEDDSSFVQLVVDILELFEDFLTLVTILAIST